MVAPFYARTPLAGWLELNGAELSRAAYPELWAYAIAQTLDEKIDEPCVETIFHWITLDTDCCARLDEIIRREVAKDTPLRAALLAFIAKEPRVDDLLAERGAYR